ncbi:hypothetical protein GCM10028778_14520 [Barrientosiimonas marina]|uniref:DUF2929 family protein n=1 Tax=Lentibacillus kimchii TaxID=1542911 RepID=A0ABW2UR59_9BACI
MRFIWPLIWTFVISCAVSYVLSSMAGNAFQIGGTLVMTIAISVAVYVLGEGMLKDESQ